MQKYLQSAAAKLLSNEGSMKDYLFGFDQRLEQQIMADEVSNAITDKEVLVCEAGTGTGKTLGYLTPIFLAKERAIISTATKALQDQLFYRDIPVVRRAVGSSKSVALLKGRQNYLCIHRMHESFGDPRIDVLKTKLLMKVKEWSLETLTGDLEELQILKETSDLKTFITSTTDNCLGTDCPKYGNCHVVNARKEAVTSDVVVVNHHLLFADMALKENGFTELLPTADIIVLDEAHTLGAYPKPSKRTKLVKQIILRQNPFVVLMSGTPTPESFSQIYHQVYACAKNPFSQYKTFYKFAKEYVNVTQQMFHSMPSNNYDDGKPEILDRMKPYMISYTQKEAGFKSKIQEHVLKVQMSELTYKFVKEMSEHGLIEGKKTKEVILGDTGVKKMSKIHQLFSGTVKLENGKRMVTDLSKAKFIRTEFKNQKIGIFYKFKAEYEALKQVYGDALTDNLKEFDTTSKSIALQIASGREGISLKKADCLVYYNIDFSALSYWQSRDRMTTKDSTASDVYWIFAEKGIETKIYKKVTKKKDYTLKHFEKDLLSL